MPGTSTCTEPGQCASNICYGVSGAETGVCVQCTDASQCPGAGSLCTNFVCETCNCPPPQTCGPNGTCQTPGGCSSDADCQASKGMEWLCDAGVSNLCYIPGECDTTGDPTIAPCPQGCAPGLLGGAAACQCTMMDGGAGCRAGETCFDLGIPGFSLGYTGGGLGFP